jgi:hypothetical protein
LLTLYISPRGGDGEGTCESEEGSQGKAVAEGPEQ